MPISVSEGKELLATDSRSFEDCVCKLDNAQYLTTNQYGALLRFAYNSGCGDVESYWYTAMSEKNFDGICEPLPTNTLGGQLDSRRA